MREGGAEVVHGAGAGRPQPTRGGHRPMAKGSRRERDLVRMLQAAGFAATRVPLSGAAGGRFRGDVSTPLFGRDLVVEVKARRRFAQLYDWIDDDDVLVIRGDRQQPLVIVRLRFAIDVAVAAERGRRPQQCAAPRGSGLHRVSDDIEIAAAPKPAGQF